MAGKNTIIARQTATGGAWMVAARLISRVIDLTTMIVLAHLLLPKDFGLVAIAMTVIYIVEAALELPLSQALVRLPTTEQTHYDTAFTLGLIRGLLLALVVCGVSWPFSRFYSDARLFPLVCVLSLAPASRGLVSPKLADFARVFDFTPDFIMELISKLAAFSAAILLALATRSYWAVAAGTLVAPIVSTCTSYILAPYRPRLSLIKLSAFSGFLGWITAAQIVSSINWQADRLLLGKLTSRTELGLFTTANDAANIPLQAFLSPLMRPLLSAYSTLREFPERIAGSYQSSAQAIVALGLPILVGEALIAPAGVRLLLGDKWAGSATILRWLAISLVPTLFAAPLGPLVMAFGRTHIFLQRNFFELCIKLPLVVLGAIKYGFIGILIARGISEVATVVYCMVLVRRLIGVPVLQQVIAPWRSIVSTCVMASVVSLLLPWLNHFTSTALLAEGHVLTVTLAVITYASSLFALWAAVGCPSGLEAMVAEHVMTLVKPRIKAAHVYE